jgi:hypothetical protein
MCEALGSIPSTERKEEKEGKKEERREIPIVSTFLCTGNSGPIKLDLHTSLILLNTKSAPQMDLTRYSSERCNANDIYAGGNADNLISTTVTVEWPIQ